MGLISFKIHRPAQVVYRSGLLQFLSPKPNPAELPFLLFLLVETLLLFQTQHFLPLHCPHPDPGLCEKYSFCKDLRVGLVSHTDTAVSKIEEQSFFDRMISHLHSTCKYYTGYPKDLGPSRVIHFTSEREFVQLLHQGHPVVVAFTIRGNYTKHLDRVLEEAAAEFYPNVKFLHVECPKYPGFCIARQKKEYPFIEIFHSPEHAANQGRVADTSITRYSVKVLPFNYDLSAYGFREFFKRHGIQTSDPK